MQKDRPSLYRQLTAAIKRNAAEIQTNEYPFRVLVHDYCCVVKIFGLRTALRFANRYGHTLLADALGHEIFEREMMPVDVRY